MDIFGTSFFGLLYIVVAFSLVIFIHEFGHFYVGKKCGIGVKEFSVGFGPRIFSFRDRTGVIWKLSLLPLGGFVKFEGDSDPSSMTKSNIKDNGSTVQFHSAPIWARFFTILAGPLANIVFSVVVFSVLVFLTGVANDKPIIGKVDTLPFQNFDIKEGDTVLAMNRIPVKSFSDILSIYGQVGDQEELEIQIKRGSENLVVRTKNLFQPIVKDVEILSPSSRAGVMIGDLILKVNGTRIFEFSELKQFVQESSGRPLLLDIWRNGIEIQKTLIPEKRPIETANGQLEETLRIGIIGGFALEPERISPGILTSLKVGLTTTWRVVYGSIKGLIEMVKGSISAKHLTGPIGIAHAVSDVSKNGFIPFFSLVALISTGIAVINLFPLPVLDGGHLLLLAYEKLVGTAPSEAFMRVFMVFGLALILSLMLFATYNDLLRIIL